MIFAVSKVLHSFVFVFKIEVNNTYKIFSHIIIESKVGNAPSLICYPHRNPA